MVVGIRNVLFMMLFLNQTLLGRGTSEKAESNESLFALSHRHRHHLYLDLASSSEATGNRTPRGPGTCGDSESCWQLLSLFLVAMPSL